MRFKKVLWIKLNPRQQEVTKPSELDELFLWRIVFLKVKFHSSGAARSSQIQLFSFFKCYVLKIAFHGSKNFRLCTSEIVKVLTKVCKKTKWYLGGLKKRDLFALSAICKTTKPKWRKMMSWLVMFVSQGELKLIICHFKEINLYINKQVRNLPKISHGAVAMRKKKNVSLL